MQSNEKDYSVEFGFILPKFMRMATFNNRKVTELSFPTRFMLTENKNYCKIEMSLLGFGLYFEIETGRFVNG